MERITGAALIPLDDLIDALLWSQDENELAEQLHVDVATVRDRLRDLSDAERKFINDEMDRREANIP